MCDTGRMFVESCPGGTIWEDLTSACVWPDMRAVQVPALAQEQIRQQGLLAPLPLSLSTGHISLL